MENRFWKDQHRVKWKKELSHLVQGHQENSVLTPELWSVEEWCSIVSVMWYSLGYEIFKESCQLKDASCLFSDGSSGKESTCNAGDPGLNPSLGRSPKGGNGNPFQYSSLENTMDRGAWRAIVHRVAKRWTWLSTAHTCLLMPEIFPLIFGLFVLSF